MNQVDASHPGTQESSEIKGSDSEKKGESRGRSYSADSGNKYHVAFKKKIPFLSLAKRSTEAFTKGNSSDEEDIASNSPPKPLVRKGSYSAFPKKKEAQPHMGGSQIIVPPIDLSKKVELRPSHPNGKTTPSPPKEAGSSGSPPIGNLTHRFPKFLQKYKDKAVVKQLGDELLGLFHYQAFKVEALNVKSFEDILDDIKSKIFQRAMLDFKNTGSKSSASNQLHHNKIRYSNWLKVELSKAEGPLLNGIFLRLKLLREIVLPQFRFVHQEKIDGKESLTQFMNNLDEALIDLLRKTDLKSFLKTINQSSHYYLGKFISNVIDLKCIELLHECNGGVLNEDLEAFLYPATFLAYTLQSVRHGHSRKWSEGISANCSDLVRTHLASRGSGNKYFFGYSTVTLVDLKGRKARIVLDEIKEKIFPKESQGDEAYDYFKFLIQEICSKGIHPEIDASAVASEIVSRALKSEEEKLHDWEIVAKLYPKEFVQIASEIFFLRNQSHILEKILDLVPAEMQPTVFMEILIILVKDQWEGSLERILDAIPKQSHLEILKIICAILDQSDLKPLSHSSSETLIEDLYQLIGELHGKEALPDRKAIGILNKNPSIFIMKILNSTASGAMERFYRKLFDKYPGMALNWKKYEGYFKGNFLGNFKESEDVKKLSLVIKAKKNGFYMIQNRHLNVYYLPKATDRNKMIKFLSKELKCHTSFSNGDSHFFSPRISSVDIDCENCPLKFSELFNSLSMFAVMMDYDASKTNLQENPKETLNPKGSKTDLKEYYSPELLQVLGPISLGKDFDFGFTNYVELKDPLETGREVEYLFLTDEEEPEKHPKGKEKEKGGERIRDN